MKPYKLKHKPTGLYYKPITNRGSHFSIRGKIYQTKTNILNMGYYFDGAPRKELKIEAHKDTTIYRQLKDSIVWEKNTWNDMYSTVTLTEDWEIEEI